MLAYSLGECRVNRKKPALSAFSGYYTGFASQAANPEKTFVGSFASNSKEQPAVQQNKTGKEEERVELIAM